MKKYMNPAFELLVISSADVITVSGLGVMVAYDDIPSEQPMDEASAEAYYAANP